MSVSSKAEGEASQKGLTGAAKRQYVGGAINRARHEKAASATPAARSKQQAHSYQREAVADARSQIRYHEAQITGLREGLKMRRELAGPAKPKRTPKPKAPPTIEQQIERAGGYVPKTPADKLRKLPVREMTDAQLLRDWENHPPERRRGVLEREMARRHAKAEKAQQPKTAKPSAKPSAKPRTLLDLDVTPLRSSTGAFSLNLGEDVDPYTVNEVYGKAQARQIYEVFSRDALRKSARKITERTGKRPKSQSHADLVDFLVAEGEPRPAKAAKPSAKPAAMAQGATGKRGPLVARELSSAERFDLERRYRAEGHGMEYSSGEPFDTSHGLFAVTLSAKPNYLYQAVYGERSHEVFERMSTQQLRETARESRLSDGGSRKALIARLSAPNPPKPVPQQQKQPKPQ